VCGVRCTAGCWYCRPRSARPFRSRRGVSTFAVSGAAQASWRASSVGVLPGLVGMGRVGIVVYSPPRSGARLAVRWQEGGWHVRATNNGRMVKAVGQVLAAVCGGREGGSQCALAARSRLIPGGGNARLRGARGSGSGTHVRAGASYAHRKGG